MNPKQAAGEKAVEFVKPGMTLGLGTGSTVQFTLEELGRRVASGLQVRGVPTSKRTEEVARKVGLPLVSLSEVTEIDLTIDGADEIDGQFSMIKGGGGALLREKIIASLSREEIIVVGQNKVVDCLGKDFLLPVEVLPFAWSAVSRQLEKLGATTHLRKKSQDAVFVTDNGNYIVDCSFAEGIPDPADLERRIDQIPGALESGLFVGLAHVLVIGNEDGSVEVRRKP